jgi:hypothetical protein
VTPLIVVGPLQEVPYGDVSKHDRVQGRKMPVAKGKGHVDVKDKRTFVRLLLRVVRGGFKLGLARVIGS